MRVMTLLGCAVAGYLLGGLWGAAGLVILWASVLLVCRQYGMDGTANVSQPEVMTGTLDVANFEAMVDSLEEVARNREWTLDKRLEIARLACENPSMPVDELEDFYDRGLRAVPQDAGQTVANDRKNDEPGWRIWP